MQNIRTFYWLSKYALYFLLLIGLVLIRNTPKVKAADFELKTGYYVGTGVAGLQISGLGFQPDLVIIKSSTTAGAAVFKTSAMPANTISFMSATASNTGTNIALNADGFTLGNLANVNSVNILYTYTAVGGSDCSATGNFCVGTYTGNGAGNRNITMGFQPTMALVKASNTIAANYRVASQPANNALFATTTATNTTGDYHRTFAATSFQVGTTNNTNAVNYYYVTFKDTAGSFSQGTYTGNGVDNRSITGLGFQPEFVMVKNSNSATAARRNPVFNTRFHHGDSSSYLGSATANISNSIQLLEANGFQVGTANESNENARVMYWYALGGYSPASTSGQFTMDSGVYTGTGSASSVTGLGFRPSLVIIKSSNTNFAVFRTSMMQGNITSYMASATAGFAEGITSLDSDGFSLGTAAQVNSNGVDYTWQAFSGAYNPYDDQGTSDFAIGAYYGNSIDNRVITGLPWQPDLVSIKSNSAAVGTWRTSSHIGDSSSFFSGTTNSTNFVQQLNADGFTIGNNASVNTNATLYYWFAFKSSSNFAVGNYTGNGSSQSISSVGFRPEYLWIKRNSTAAGVNATSILPGTGAQYFTATANASGIMNAYNKLGFTVSSNLDVNASGGQYFYVSWNNPSSGFLSIDVVDAVDTSVATPVYDMNSLAYNFNCTTVDGLFGTASQKIRVKNTTSNPLWTLSLSATSGASSQWQNTGLTENYDYNDPQTAGCADGVDSDSQAGRLGIDASVGTLDPETGCTTTNLSLNSIDYFSEGSQDSIELITSGSGADSDCTWDLTDALIEQTIPAEQPIGSYDINLTLTVIAN